MQTGLTGLPRYARIGLAAALVTSVPLVLRLSWLEPRMRELDAKRAEVAAKEAGLTEARREQADLARARRRVDELGLTLDHLGGARPDGEDLSAPLRRLQILAVESDLTIRAFRPRPPLRDEPRAAWSYRLHLDGTYPGLARFFRQVGGLSSIVTIEDVVIRAIDPPEPGRTIAAECTATAFGLPDPSRLGPAGAEEAR